ncbi:unnamed protein product [Notodromas monacha]|uniref:GP-PDE domain-containing protein n=1 Tax=Notodromas monacha TaxID=399045 RepID=A0A7R9BEX4_9CRUS|nr:unnamed protein product [Notodromas monacha]CAG0914113.1 unnamed protein product [Notodromas monacha]
MSSVPRGFLLSVAVFTLIYAFVSFLFSLLISFGLFVIFCSLFVVFISYARIPAPSQKVVEEILGLDYYEVKSEDASNLDKECPSSSGFVMPIVAHRGACLDAPENSLTAFRLVKLRGVHGVELDVSLTKDKVPIVFHDEVVDRVTNGAGRVVDLTYEEIKELDLSTKFIFPQEFSLERIPKLSEAIDLCLDLDLRIMIDVKEPDSQLADAVLAEYKRRPELKKRAMVSSFFPNIIYLVRLGDPDIVCSMAVRPNFFAYKDFIPGFGPSHPRFDAWWKHWGACFLDQLLEISQYSFTPYFLGLSAILSSHVGVDIVKLSHWRSQGLRVFIWTLNDPVAKKYCHEVLRTPYLTDTLDL